MYTAAFTGVTEGTGIFLRGVTTPTGQVLTVPSKGDKEDLYDGNYERK